MVNVISDSKKNTGVNFGDTPKARRLHIGFFGKRNAGKSSLINAVTGQEISIVSKIPGTTTDPVIKSMEILPLGPVMLIDTPGLDDLGELGEERVKKTKNILETVDIAVIVIELSTGLSLDDLELMHKLKKHKIPFLIAATKADLQEGAQASNLSEEDTILNSGENIGKSTPTELFKIPKEFKNIKILMVSSKTGYGIDTLKEALASFNVKKPIDLPIIRDVVPPEETVILVTPVDDSAPKGRIILPQVETIRDLLDGNCNMIITEPDRLKSVIDNLKNSPYAVITDSRVFKEVSSLVPSDIFLTSFSILFARYNGILKMSLSGISHISNLKDGDQVLISEGCTHHVQCDDIGRYKIPQVMKKLTGKSLVFCFTQGGKFPDDLSPYSLIIHCGGCMLTKNEMKRRQRTTAAGGVPFTNYGILLAHATGILPRITEIFNQNT